MARVKIEKFVDGTREKALHVPIVVLAAARTLLPRSALDSLAKRGFKVREILEASRNGRHYAKTVYVREHGVDKKIVVSLNQAARR